MCIDRIQSYINNGYSKKYYPACAKTCTADAIYFGPREEMVAVGDGFNDLSMIKFAGLGVAMANAQEVVRQHADYITLSNEEDGVAAVVDRFFLN